MNAITAKKLDKKNKNINSIKKLDNLYIKIASNPYTLKIQIMNTFLETRVTYE